MGYAIKCPVGGPDFVDGPGLHPCKACGGEHVAYACGVPTASGGYPMVQPPFPRGYSRAHGKHLTSWSEYHAANEVAGLVDVGHGPQLGKKLSRPRTIVRMR